MLATAWWIYLCHLSALFPHNTGSNKLLHASFWFPKHCGILCFKIPASLKFSFNLNSLMGHQQLLKLVGIEMIVLVLDQLLQPSVKVEVAGLVVMTEVARVKEPVLAKEPFVLLGLVEVAEHRVVGLVGDLPDHVGTERRASVGVNDLHSFGPL